MKYKIWNVNTDWAINSETGAMILMSEDAEFLAWAAEGNIPEPADPLPELPTITDPVEKLRAFLDANPDVKAILQ